MLIIIKFYIIMRQSNNITNSIGYTYIYMCVCVCVCAYVYIA